jgi:DNA-binding transcriptional MerR regulator
MKIKVPDIAVQKRFNGGLIAAVPSPTQPAKASAAAVDDARYRTGAVARMAGMPVGTLRTWERRFGVTSSVQVRNGHRLYTAADVSRMVMLKRLTDLGHAIGTVADLDTAQLRRLSESHAKALMERKTTGHYADANADIQQPRRVAVVGSSLAQRLQRPAIVQGHGSALICPSTFDRLAEALTSLLAGDVGCVVLQVADLNKGLMDELLAAADTLPAGAMAVLYSHAGEELPDRLVAAGVSVRREPISDARLVTWLRRVTAADMPALQWNDTTLPPGPPAPRRFDDNALADLAGLSSTVFCECPKHLADILVQLSRFEDYSAECAARDQEDAAMHVYLQRVTGGARRHFEVALERVARHEGLLPPR